MSISAIFTAILTLLPLTIAIPTPSQRATTENWHIPRLDMHMMSTTTGLPGDTWPPGSAFDTTIDFDIVMPNPAADTIVNCKAAFANGTLPEGWTACGEEGEVRFGMTPYNVGPDGRADMSFMLAVQRMGDDGGLLGGEVAITANDPSKATSWLTCLLGIPMDGLRCKIGSYLSVNGELVVEGMPV